MYVGVVQAVLYTMTFYTLIYCGEQTNQIENKHTT